MHLNHTPSQWGHLCRPPPPPLPPSAAGTTEENSSRLEAEDGKRRGKRLLLPRGGVRGRGVGKAAEAAVFGAGGESWG